ncbi:MAG TPA: AMP-binding protein [Stellaceae bacterium]|nr:AMP-binding protein [Stellaceae bacterium]
MAGMAMDYFLRRALRLHAGRVALVAGGRRVLYRELDRRSSRLAAGLMAAGLRRGDRLALLLGVTPRFFETEIAAAKAGLVKVPVNTRLAMREIVKTLASCGARAAVADPPFAEALADARADLPELATVIKTGGPGALPEYERLIADGSDDFQPREASAAGDIYSIRFSGGTTGEPKGIVHTHAAYVAISLAVLREYEVAADERSLQVTHPAHGANFTWPALLARGTEIHLLERYDPGAVLRVIAAERLTRVPMVPAMWQGVLDHAEMRATDWSSVRTCASISAPMAVERVRQMLDRLGPRLMNVYTLSESPVMSTILKKEDFAAGGARLASCGREAEDVRLRIVDPAGRDVAAGEIGEIILSSPGNMLCYWNNRQLTAETLRDGWVWTGDMGRRDEEGFVYLVDRRSEMIVTGGFNVYPREVEEVLYEHPAVREAAVAGVPDPRWGEAVAAFVALHRGAACTEAELLGFCDARIAHYKKPKSVRFLDDLPKTSAGKISRRALADPFWSGRDRRIG